MEEFRIPHEEEMLPAVEKPDESAPDRVESIASRLKSRHEASQLPPEVAPPIQLEQLAAQAELGPALTQEMVSIEQVAAEPETEKGSGLHEASKRLQEVFEAAENDLPEEAKNERRHEIRQEPEPSDDSGLADSIGTVLANLHQKASAAHAAFSRTAPKVAPKVPLPKAFTSLPALYKKAVVLGFGMAIVILVGMSLLR